MTISKSFAIPFLQSSSLKVTYYAAALAASKPSTARANSTADELTPDELFSFAPFRDWLKSFETALQQAKANGENYEARQIEIQSMDFFGDRIGFLKFKLDLYHPNKRALPGVTVLRGGSVGMFVVLEENDTPEREQYVVLVQQPRVPAASTGFLEIPAGMIDESVQLSSSEGAKSDGAFTGAAARELEEEVGITITSSELVDLAPEFRPLYLSPGLLDETMKLYAYEAKLPSAEIKKMQGKLRERTEGSENEVIHLRIVKKKEMWNMAQMQDMKSLLALSLYDRGARRK